MTRLLIPTTVLYLVTALPAVPLWESLNSALAAESGEPFVSKRQLRTAQTSERPESAPKKLQRPVPPVTKTQIDPRLTQELQSRQKPITRDFVPEKRQQPAPAGPKAEIDPPKQVVTQGQPAIFYSKSIADPDVPISAQHWSGPGGQTSNQDRFTVNTAQLKPSTYRVTLVVRDGWQRQGQDSATLIVEAKARASDDVRPSNQPPVARITPGRIEVPQGQHAQFDGSRSSDPDGKIRSWIWRLDGRQTNVDRAVQFDTANLNLGNHTVSLEVVDDRGARHFAETILTVRPPPAQVQPPVAIISPDRSRVTQGVPVRFFNRSYHPDRNRRIIASSWQTSWGERADGDYIDIDTRQLNPGQYSVILRVVDDNNVSNSARAVLTIDAAKASIPPVAVITPNHLRVNQGARVTFSDASYHPTRDTKIISRHWNTQWGQAHGGPTLSIDTASLSPGTYWIALQVVDQYQRGDNTRAVLEVVHTPPPQQPPIARITPGRIEIQQHQTARFDGSRSSDPDGKLRSWVWSLNNRPIDRQPLTRIDTGGLNPGEYIVRLEVTDEQGLTARDEARLVVIEPGPLFDAAITGLEMSSGSIAPNREVQIRAIVSNGGKDTLHNVPVRFEVAGIQIAQQMLPLLAPGETREVTARWIPGSAGEQIVIATVNPDNQPPENNTTNNQRRLSFLVPTKEAVRVEPKPPDLSQGDAPKGSEIRYAVTLRVPAGKLRAGDSATFVSHLDPATPGVEYLFQFGDGENSGWTRAATVSHAYRAEGAYNATVSARMGGAAISQSPPLRLVVGSAAGWSWLWLGGGIVALAAALEVFRRVRRLRNKIRVELVPQLNLQELRVETAGQRVAGFEIGLRTARGQSRVQVEASGPIAGQRN